MHDLGDEMSALPHLRNEFVAPGGNVFCAQCPGVRADDVNECAGRILFEARLGVVGDGLARPAAYGLLFPPSSTGWLDNARSFVRRYRNR